MQYECIKNGDLEQAIPLSIKLFRSDLTGHLSDNRTSHYRYLFVASTTLSCRFWLEGGMLSEYPHAPCQAARAMTPTSL